MRMRSPLHPIGLLALVILQSTSFARIGEDLTLCQGRYGAGKQLELPAELNSIGIKAYEFQREPYTVLAFIGKKGAMQIAFFKRGPINDLEAVDLIKRNAPESAEVKNVGLTGDGSRSWLVGEGPQMMSCFLATGPAYSRLMIRKALLMGDSGAAVSAVHNHGDQFLKNYFEKLNTGAAEDAAQRQSQANEGL